MFEAGQLKYSLKILNALEGETFAVTFIGSSDISVSLFLCFSAQNSIAWICIFPTFGSHSPKRPVHYLGVVPLPFSSSSWSIAICLPTPVAEPFSRTLKQSCQLIPVIVLLLHQFPLDVYQPLYPFSSSGFLSSLSVSPVMMLKRNISNVDLLSTFPLHGNWS